jgi:hypothetical protein
MLGVDTFYICDVYFLFELVKKKFTTFKIKISRKRKDAGTVKRKEGCGHANEQGRGCVPNYIFRDQRNLRIFFIFLDELISLKI